MAPESVKQNTIVSACVGCSSSDHVKGQTSNSSSMWTCRGGSVDKCCTIVDADRTCEPYHDPNCQDEGIEAMPAEEEVSALDLTGKWLCDPGAARDLFSQVIATENPDSVHAAPKPVHFVTANGKLTSEQVLQMRTLGLGSDVSDAYVLKNSPSALSIGQRVLHKGYSFVWIQRKRPCLILPEGGVSVI